MNKKHLSIFLIIGLSSLTAMGRQATREEIRDWCQGRSTLDLRATNMSMQQACAFYQYSPQTNAAAATPDVAPANPTSPMAAFEPAEPPADLASRPRPQSDLAVADPNSPCRTPELTSHIPRRTQNGIPQLSGDMGTTRDGQVVAAVEAGNIPDFLRNLRPVQMPSRSCMGSSSPITLCVMPDYLAVGNDSQFLHTPIGFDAATRLAGEMGFFLPTTAMVDAIFSQAQERVTPSTRTPDRTMTTTSVFTEHSRYVQNQFQGSLGQLRAGHQKDVVMTNRSGGVPIYGWHNSSGRRIQPLYLGHQNSYSDYSHGIRMVSQTAFIDGRPYPLATLLSDGSCAQALSSEGPIGASVTRRYPSPIQQNDPPLLAEDGVTTGTSF